MKEERIYGESGLDSEFFAEHDEQERPVENPDGIKEALKDMELDETISDSPLFKEYYEMISAGPGKDWDSYRRAKLTIQTMNRAGCIDLAPLKRKVEPVSSAPRADASHEEEIREKVDNVTSAGDVYLPKAGTRDLFDDYNPLTSDEIKDNLMVAGGIAGVVALAALSVFFGVKTKKPGIAAAGGAFSVAAFIAVTARLAGHYHHRFKMKYRLTRLLVCLALIFSNSARFAVKEFWILLCRITDYDIPVIPFGMILTVTLLLMALWSYIALCRTFIPSRAKTIGWLSALSVTFAIGSFLFSAIS